MRTSPSARLLRFSARQLRCRCQARCGRNPLFGDASIPFSASSTWSTFRPANSSGGTVTTRSVAASAAEGRRHRLDCGDHGADERLEDQNIRRAGLPSSSSYGHCVWQIEGGPTSWPAGLLSRRTSPVAALPGVLPNGKKAVFAWWSVPAGWLWMGLDPGCSAAVSRDLIQFHQHEQMLRLLHGVSKAFRLGAVRQASS